MTTSITGFTSILSQYALAPLDGGAPAPERMVDALVNWVGCAIGGCRTETVNAAIAAIGSYGQGGQFPVLGRSEHFHLPDAVLLDCLGSASLGFDDAHLETILHPTGPVAAALLGLSRTMAISGKAFIAALGVGMEVQCRAALAFTDPSAGAKRGWYSTGLAGGIGAAAALGRLLDLDEARMQAALGLAATRACGNRATHGSMACAYVPALAAESGFVAAKLAQAGFTCDGSALDGPRGLIALVARQPAIERATRDLGTVSEAMRNTYKPYPCGIVIHPVIDACLALHREHGVTPDKIRTAEFQISTAAHALCLRQNPASTEEAQVSLFHWAAATLMTGQAGTRQADIQAICDPAIRELQRRVAFVETPGIAEDACKARFDLDDGRRIEIAVEHALGSLARPMSPAQIDDKFIGLCDGILPDREAADMLRSCRNVLAMADVGAGISTV